MSRTALVDTVIASDDLRKVDLVAMACAAGQDAFPLRVQAAMSASRR